MKPFHTAALAVCAIVAAASAQPVIYASGQLLIPGTDGHDDSRENYLYEINTLTGEATAISPVTSGLPAAMGATASGHIFGFSAGQLVEINPTAGTTTAIGANNGLSSTAFDITASGSAYITPFDGDFNTQQLFNIDLHTGAATAIGSASAIGDAIDTARGTALGTAEPFVISLGSVGNTLYGIDLDTDTLVSIDSLTGAAGVIGSVGAVGLANGGGYSGFSALTGVDEDLDGSYDALFGSVNYDPAGERIGGLARFDLTTGEWSLVGTNDGLIYFGFASSPVPAPGAASVLALGGVLASGRWRKSHAAR